MVTHGHSNQSRIPALGLAAYILLALCCQTVDLDKLAAMNRAHRVLLTIYSLVVAYCLAWIPWCIPRRNVPCERVGYGGSGLGPRLAAVTPIFRHRRPDLCSTILTHPFISPGPTSN